MSGFNYENVTDEQSEEITCAVIEMAEQIFIECGAESDFCVQSASGLVFGGVNRLILTGQGWKIDRPYCTPRFIKQFELLRLRFLRASRAANFVRGSGDSSGFGMIQTRK